jgi:hypothetical protein
VFEHAIIARPSNIIERTSRAYLPYRGLTPEHLNRSNEAGKRMGLHAAQKMRT